LSNTIQFRAGDFDTVLFGSFLYHTIKQFDFFAEIHRLAPENLIIYTVICQIPSVFKKSPDISDFLKNLIKQEGNWHKPLAKAMNSLISGQYFVFIKEDTHREGSTIDPSGIMAIPSDKAIEMLLALYGFTYHKINWHTSDISDWHYLEDYQQGDRVS
jgi:hypothetical protein